MSKNRNRWWRSKRSTKVELDKHNKFVSCRYHSTTVVEADHKRGLVTLRNNGHMTKTTLERINQCASEYGFPYVAYSASHVWYVAVFPLGMRHRWQKAQIIEFYNGIEIPLAGIPDNGLTLDQVRRPLVGSDPRDQRTMYVTVTGDLSDLSHSNLRLQLGQAWSKKLQKYLKMFEVELPESIDLSGQEALIFSKTWMRGEVCARLNQYRTGIRVNVNCKHFLRNYVGYDADLWLVD